MARKKSAEPAARSRTQQISRAAALLRQAPDPTRLQILLLLGEGERNVTELCKELGGTSQPAVSHHLALLRHGRLIEPRRHGKHNYYALTEQGESLASTIARVMA
jgi:DNA-binding transcriptional ArsR family regulator